jgi:hypothetical protein
MVFSLGSWGSLFCSDKKKSGIPKVIAVEKVTISRCYYVVVDLNGILVLRGVYHRGQERAIIFRLGCRSFLEWIWKRAVLSLWSSVNDRNIEAVLKVVLDGASFTRNDITILIQSVDDVLLVDNTPMKNLFNDSYSAVHPPSWYGEPGCHTGRPEVFWRANRAGERAALSITPYMNWAGYCRQRNYCSKFTLLQ